ncbi:MAG TPA: hypothetical protein VMF69_00165 [Gemmataceae bacterium]|nr:hypothetical protein [Gemmataceae bacterium]
MTDASRSAILPVAKGIYLCDYVIDYENGKVDLYGLFNAIRSSNHPHVQGRFCVFAQLINGLGRVPFFIDIRDAARHQLIHTTQTNHLSFPDRNTVVQLAVSIEQCLFPQAGMYLVELYCDNTWVCDTNLLLH